jgi:mRNA-degrading endonuclease RelE of RelBE toxin-antitoxin system
MNAIKKALKKLSAKERARVKEVLAKLASEKTQGLDIKKLQGRNDVFRVWKGDIRIVYQKSDKAVSILLIERRSEKTYGL